MERMQTSTTQNFFLLLRNFLPGSTGVYSYSGDQRFKKKIKNNIILNVKKKKK
jgi:hypothetical protein